MKTKIILTIILALLGLCAIAQIQGYRAVYYVPYKSTVINRGIIQGTQVYTDSAGIIEHYLCVTPFGNGTKLSTAISDGYVRVWNSNSDTLFIGNYQYMYEKNTNGVKFNNSVTATDTLFAPVIDGTSKVLVGAFNVTAKNSAGIIWNHSASATDSLIAPVVKGSTKLQVGNFNVTTKNTNGVVWNHSTTATDTSFAPVVDATTKVVVGVLTCSQKNPNGVVWNHSSTITDTAYAGTVNLSGGFIGTSAVRDTFNFGTDASGNRNKFIRRKIIGVVAGDRFVITPVLGTPTAILGAGEWIGYYCTTDSLIISRNTASTAGLKVSFVRIR